MKINQVEIFDVHCPDRPQWSPVFVRIHTDEGIHGVGEAGLAYDLGHSAAASMIKEFADAFLIGFDPFNTERLWQKMLRNSFWALNGGPIIYAAMSAIDIALWDIKGKALQQPIYQLLGGKVNDSLRTYASQIQFGWSDEVIEITEPHQYAEESLKAVSQGYDAIKVNPILFRQDGSRYHSHYRLITQREYQWFRSRFAAMRDAVGAKVDIILECHSLPSATTAIQIAELASEFNCLFMEEPVNYLNHSLHKKVAQKTKLPLAAGERLYHRWDVRPYLEDQSIDILQPDVCLSGGFTETKKVCDYAEIFDVNVQLHVCGGPIATAAALHLETALPNFFIHEHHTYATKPWNKELCQQDLQPVNGQFVVSEAPGLGIELNDQRLKNSTKLVIK